MPVKNHQNRETDKLMKNCLKPTVILTTALLCSTIIVPIVIAATASKLAPYTAKYPGKRTFDDPGDTIPATVQAFARFKDRLGISWDDEAPSSAAPRQIELETPRTSRF